MRSGFLRRVAPLLLAALCAGCGDPDDGVVTATLGETILVEGGELPPNEAGFRVSFEAREQPDSAIVIERLASGSNRDLVEVLGRIFLPDEDDREVEVRVPAEGGGTATLPLQQTFVLVDGAGRLSVACCGVTPNALPNLGEVTAFVEAAKADSPLIVVASDDPTADLDPVVEAVRAAGPARIVLLTEVLVEVPTAQE